jgi:hypothetical protein
LDSSKKVQLQFLLFFQTFREEAKRGGLGWHRTDGSTFGVQVDDILHWARFFVLLFEQKSSTKVYGTICFKLAIDARSHWNRGGQVNIFYMYQFITQNLLVITYNIIRCCTMLFNL